MKAFCLALFLCVFVQIPAPAQEPTPPPADTVFGDNVSGDRNPVPTPTQPPPVPDIPLMPATLTTLIPTNSGPSNTIGLDTSPGVHATFRLAMVVIVVGTDGGVVDPSTVTIGASVSVHFLKDRDDLIIDRIFLQ